MYYMLFIVCGGDFEDAWKLNCSLYSEKHNLIHRTKTGEFSLTEPMH